MPAEDVTAICIGLRPGCGFAVAGAFPWAGAFLWAGASALHLGDVLVTWLT